MIRLPRIMSQTITRVRKVETSLDRYNQPITTDDRLDIARCSLQPGSSRGLPRTQEVIDGGDLVTTEWRLFAPAGADIVSTDYVEFGSVTYEVDGDPQTWPNSRGIPHHIEVRLRRVSG